MNKHSVLGLAGVRLCPSGSNRERIRGYKVFPKPTVWNLVTWGGMGNSPFEVDANRLDSTPLTLTGKATNDFGLEVRFK